MERMDSFCGLYCGACDIFLARRKGTLAELSRKWGRTEKDLTCNGCKTEIVSIYCQKCPIKVCALAKKLDYCFQCSLFPCKEVVEFNNDQHPHHSIVLFNLALLREKGTEEWLCEQDKRWKCPNCASPFSWYDEICPACRTRVKSCRAEEKEMGT